jgi:hypothetical protein
VSKLAASLVLALGAAPLTDGALRPQIDKLVAAVGAARRLPYHGTLPLRALGRDEAARASALAVGEGLDHPTARTEDEILRRLGLVPAASSVGDLAARSYALGAPASARYDALTGTLLVPDFLPFEAQRTEIAHQIAHAVTDQRFGLRRFLRLAPEGEPRLDGDATRARLCIVEGDAVLAGLELADPAENFLGTHALGALGARLRGAPSPASGWFAALGELTHVDGLLFVARVRRHRPFGAVDALWNEPPASTEQVLHPEKYDACEAPIPVDVAALPTLAGFGRPSASDVLGEWAIRTWLGATLPAEIAARAAAGWGGDRVGLYTPQATAHAPADGGAAAPAPEPLAWLTVWDGPAEADDFARTAAERLAKLSGAEAPDDEGGRTIFRTPAGAFALARRDDAVALLIGAPDPAAPALDAMLDAVRPRASRRAAPRPRRAAQPGCPRRDRAAAPG